MPRKTWQTQNMCTFWRHDSEEFTKEYPEYCRFMKIARVDAENAIIEIHMLPELGRECGQSLRRGDIIEVVNKNLGDPPDLYVEEQVVMRCKIIKMLSKSIKNLSSFFRNDDDELVLVIEAIGDIELLKGQDT